MLLLKQASLCETACTVRLPLHEAHAKMLAQATLWHATLVVAKGGEPRRKPLAIVHALGGADLAVILFDLAVILVDLAAPRTSP